MRVQSGGGKPRDGARGGTEDKGLVPARVVVPTGPLYGGCLVEIEAVAQRKEKGEKE